MYCSGEWTNSQQFESIFLYLFYCMMLSIYGLAIIIWTFHCDSGNFVVVIFIYLYTHFIQLYRLIICAHYGENNTTIPKLKKKKEKTHIPPYLCWFKVSKEMASFPTWTLILSVSLLILIWTFLVPSTFTARPRHVVVSSPIPTEISMKILMIIDDHWFHHNIQVVY